MSERALHVWLDRYGTYEEVGSITGLDGELRFRYSLEYTGNPISASLPLQREAFDPYTTQTFFSGLTPEGGMRAYFQRILRIGSSDYAKLLERLNDESLGALVFSTSFEPPGGSADYTPIPENLFESFASNPTLVANQLNNESRLSLTGAMAKIGLYKHPDTQEWYIPFGAMPSTHIVKAGNESFPSQTVNEALCMEAARLCGFAIPNYRLLDVGANQPLFIVERYDRVFPERPLVSMGCPVPRRLHQEDFAQATSVAGDLKYEPTDGGYFERVVACAASNCKPNGYGESCYCIEKVFFDYLVGNCDNHLKNFSLLYSADLSAAELSPLYDVTCTTVYGLDPEMGVSFGGTRRITDVTREQIRSAVSRANRPPETLMQSFDQTAEVLPDMLRKAAASIADQGFEEAVDLASRIAEGVEERRRKTIQPIYPASGRIGGDPSTPALRACAQDDGEEL